jgi:hypothetical protein
MARRPLPERLDDRRRSAQHRRLLISPRVLSRIFVLVQWSADTRLGNSGPLFSESWWIASRQAHCHRRMPFAVAILLATEDLGG